MPDSHRLNFHYIDSDARLTAPLAKAASANHATPTTWPAAIAAAASRLKSLAPAQTAVIASGRMTNEELFLTRLLAEKSGISQLALVPRLAEPDGLLIAADRNPNTTGASLVLAAADPFAPLAAIRDGVRSGAIKGLIVLGEDLVTDAGFTTDDLAKLDFLLVSHLLANPTAKNAHIVLPTAAFTEKRGSMVNLTGRLQRLNRATELPGQARDDWEVLRDLIEAVTGTPTGLSKLEDVFAQLASTVPAFANLSLAAIDPAGLSIHDTCYKIPLLVG
jgi:NADH-quinone oxidoreductase subunit G